MSNSSIWPIHRNLSVATTAGQNGPESDGIKGVLYISESSSITGVSPSEFLVSYPWDSLGGGSYHTAEMQSVYPPTSWLGSITIKSIEKCKKSKWESIFEIIFYQKKYFHIFFLHNTILNKLVCKWINIKDVTEI